MFRKIGVILTAVATIAFGFFSVPSAIALTYSPCSTGSAGFGFSFWNPYDDPGTSAITTDYDYQNDVNELGYVVDWSIDEDAHDADYPTHLSGYSVFNTAIPDLLSGIPSRAAIFFGLGVGPSTVPANWTNWSWLETQLTLYENLADDLYSQYGSRVKGWYIPTEPNEALLSNYSDAYQYGVWLGQITSYLHSHDGNHGVMVALLSASAQANGDSMVQFAQQAWPMMANAGFGANDVWNIEDGFDLTSPQWTTSQEIAGFQQFHAYASESGGGQVWSDIYTPASATPTQFEPYLQALAPYTNLESQWLFYEYMDPPNTAQNPNALSDFDSYYTYCM
ncbi:MAG: DUF4434 domain-containing protein [Acidimicrobiales bacterium]